MNKWELSECFEEVKDEYVEEILPYTVPGKGHGRRLLVLGLAAAVILLLGMTVYAAVQPEVLAAWFPRFFAAQEDSLEEITRNQAEIMEKGLVPIGKSQTHNGYTVTLQSGISDSRRAILIFEVTAPEGTILDSDVTSVKSCIDIEVPSPGEGNYAAAMRGGFRIPDHDPQDNRLLIAEEMIVQPPENAPFSLADGAVGKIHIEAILDCSDRENAPAVLAEGPWEFTCEFSDELVVMQEKEMLEKPVKMGAQRSLKADNFQTTIKVTSFKLRTLSATCIYQIPLLGRWEGIRPEPITLIMKDGSRIPAHFRLSLNRGKTDECTYIFDRPVSVEDVDHIEFSK